MVAAQAVLTEPLLLSAWQRQADCPAEKCSLSVPPACYHPATIPTQPRGNGEGQNLPVGAIYSLLQDAYGDRLV